MGSQGSAEPAGTNREDMLGFHQLEVQIKSISPAAGTRTSDQKNKENQVFLQKKKQLKILLGPTSGLCWSLWFCWTFRCFSAGSDEAAGFCSGPTGERVTVAPSPTRWQTLVQKPAPEPGTRNQSEQRTSSEQLFHF